MRSSIIIVGGLPGTGKTTVAEILSDELNIPLYTKDILEAAVIRRGIASVDNLNGVGYELMATLATNELLHGRSTILDCIASLNRVDIFWSEMIKGDIKYIECICSDVSIHKERIETRKRNIPGWYELSWDKVVEIQEVYQPFSDNRLVLDTTDNLESNIKKAIKYVHKHSM